MRACASFVVAVLLAGALGASAQDLPTNLPPLPPRETNIDPVVWTNYSRQVLLILFPTRAKLVRKLTIEVLLRDQAVNAGTNVRVLMITTGLIRFVRDEHEFAGVLAHEFGHRLHIHPSPARPPRSFAEMANLAMSGSPAIDWRLYLQEEYEADFVSTIVARHLATPLQTFERRVKEVPTDPIWAESEAQRCRALRGLIALRDLTTLVAARPLPRRLPSRSATYDEWIVCARNTLAVMYPAYADQIARLDIRFFDDTNLIPKANIVVYEDGHRGIGLNPACIRAVIRTPLEFGTLLGHEFGHIILDRGINTDLADTDPALPSENYLREESEADLFGTLPLERGDCAFATVLERLRDFVPDGYTKIENPDDRARANHLRATCALNY